MIIIPSNEDDEVYSSEEMECEARNQVELDAIRTFSRFSKHYAQNERDKIVLELVHFVCAVLVKNPNLHYYQGYHDVCLTLQLVREHSCCSPELLKRFQVQKMLNEVTQSHLRDYMEPTMEKTIQTLENIIPLIDAVNQDLAARIYRSGVGVIFALSWLITWFGHVIDDIDILARLYDLFISSHKLMPLYVSASVVCFQSTQIMDETIDMPCLHRLLTKLPSTLTQNEFEDVIADSCALFDAYPPDELCELEQKWNLRRSSLERYDEQLMDIDGIQGGYNYKPKFEFIRRLAVFAVTLGLGAAATILMYNHVQQNPDIGLNDFLSLIYGWH
ncbi:hypothetical protein ACOME3_002963 [Neoechinorhynchus agilis]